MNLTFVCQNCDDSFEIDFGQLVEEARSVKCPNCGKRLPAADVEELTGAIEDVLHQVAALRKRFLISFDIDAEDLPAPYDSDVKKSSRRDDDDEDDEDDEDEDDDQDELDADDEDEDDDRY